MSLRKKGWCKKLFCTSKYITDSLCISNLLKLNPITSGLPKRFSSFVICSIRLQTLTVSHYWTTGMSVSCNSCLLGNIVFFHVHIINWNLEHFKMLKNDVCSVVCTKSGWLIEGTTVLTHHSPREEESQTFIE